ncbi:MAG: sensor histidine kinase [bacterium]|nr:sensor histidine kinase [bacterium]
MDKRGGLRHYISSVCGILVLFLITILVPVIILQAVIYYNRFDARRADELQSNLELARAISAAFSAYVNDILRQEKALSVMFASPVPLPESYIRRVMAGSAGEYPGLRDFAWINTKGIITVSSRPGVAGLDISDRSYFQNILKGKSYVVSDLFTPRTGDMPSFVIARAVRSDSGRLIGVMRALVVADGLRSVLTVHRPEQGAIAVIDSRGYAVYGYPEVHMSWRERNWAGSQAVLRRALAGTETTGIIASALTGKDIMVGITPVNGTEWVAEASRPVSEAMAPVYREMFRNFLLLLTVAFIAFILAVRISRRITVPLNALRKSSQAIGLKGYTERVQVSGPEEIEELAATINTMSEDIRFKEEERESYIHTISHDLRAPLTLIQGHAQLLQRFIDEAGIDDNVCLSVVTIIKNTHSMNTMIQDLVDSARLSSGQLKLDIKSLDLRKFVINLLEEAGTVMDMERVKAYIPHGLPNVKADPARLERIMMNLLSNGLKYSEGEVTVSAEKTDDMLTVSVSDYGTGIPEEEQPLLFERFYRAKGAGRREGLGLGLYITKGLVEAHGGHIWLSSQAGVGNTFCFTLPIHTIK